MSDSSLSIAENKRAVKDYVNQLNTLELEKLKLKQLNVKLKGEQDDLMNEADLVISNAKIELDCAQNYYKNTLSMKNGAPKHSKMNILEAIKETLMGCGLGFFVSGLINVPIIIFAEHLATLPVIIGFVLFFMLVGGALCFSPHYTDWKAENKRNKEQFDQRVAGLQKDFDNIEIAKEKVEKSKIESEAIKKQAQTIDQQIKINEQNITKIGLLIQKMHELDIIPPDYRTVDCIITLDHIFNNDLADTVRDAVLLYKDWVYHELIIIGIEKIYEMLGNLSASMQYMQRTLESIDQSVSAMSDDMTRLIGLQKESNRTQEQILQESQATRSATESIRQSNEKYEWYVEQHRQGLL